MGATRRPGVKLVELRVLDGPNLYFARPAIKLTLGVDAWLDRPEQELARLAGKSGITSRHPGAPSTQQRQRYVAQMAAQLTRELAIESGTRLAVRGRLGAGPSEVVVAYPWRRRNLAETLGQEVPGLMDAGLDRRRSLEIALREAAQRVRSKEPGPAPAVPRPTVPVVAVTGTNGKTTTVRLLAHLLRGAGHRVAYTSTDGVYVDDRMTQEGDYSGFGGAGHALAEPGISIAVLETARGGILLRGIGTAHNNVAVVTNVSEDHLDQYGIRTLDQLAEVKASITRITRPEGWDVLNADDPRVLAMRRHATGKPWLFSLDADHPAIRSALNEGGRAISIVDGWLAVFLSARQLRRLLPLEEVPVTLAGISSHNIQNAMAATAAALGVGAPEEMVVEGLRTFVMDPERNPGRTNLFELEGRLVVVDYAHNEEGMKGLVETCQGLRGRGKVYLAFGAAGDRTEGILHRLGYVAARGSDRVAIAELRRYLRGRDPVDLVRRLRAGAIDGGAVEVPDFPNEVTALKWMLAESARGDVVAVAALSQRPEIFALMEERGATRVQPERLREIVRRNRES